MVKPCSKPKGIMGVDHIVLYDPRLHGSRLFDSPKEGAIVEWFRGVYKDLLYLKGRCS